MRASKYYTCTNNKKAETINIKGNNSDYFLIFEIFQHMSSSSNNSRPTSNTKKNYKE